ncbi:permease [Citrobacter braakii]|nr:permease [Citrobacter braakii]
MSGLKQELGLAQGIGLLSTSLLGTGVFAVPALAALVAGNNSLWAWPVLIVLVFPVAIVFAVLGRHFPSAGGGGAFCWYGLWLTPGARHRMAIFVGDSRRLACGITYRRRIWSSDVWLA